MDCLSVLGCSRNWMLWRRWQVRSQGQVLIVFVLHERESSSEIHNWEVKMSWLSLVKPERFACFWGCVSPRPHPLFHIQ